MARGELLYNLQENDVREVIAMATMTAVFRRGVFEPRAHIDLPDNTEVTLHVAETDADPKDALLDDEETLLALYAACAEEDRELASLGLDEWVRTLEREERRA